MRRLLLVARVGVVRSRANRVHPRTPDRVAANVPAVAGALFHKRSALKIDAVVGEKRYRARCAVRGACRGAQCGACRGARLRRGEVVYPTISMMRYGCDNTLVENLASLSSVHKPLR